MAFLENYAPLRNPGYSPEAQAHHTYVCLCSGAGAAYLVTLSSVLITYFRTFQVVIK